jgi:hypothetical protein
MIISKSLPPTPSTPGIMEKIQYDLHIFFDEEN